MGGKTNPLNAMLCGTGINEIRDNAICQGKKKKDGSRSSPPLFSSDIVDKCHMFMVSLDQQRDNLKCPGPPKSIQKTPQFYFFFRVQLT
jgi:hypothetical protein